MTTQNALVEAALKAPGIILMVQGMVMVNSNPNHWGGYVLIGGGILLIVVKYVVTDRRK